MLDLFKKHLTQMQRERIISTWTDNEIRPGGKLDKLIEDELHRSDLFFALVSPFYIASNYCYDIEFQTALKLYNDSKLTIIPIIVDPCDWQNTPFKTFKALPDDGKPVSMWDNVHDAFQNCIKQLRKLSIPTDSNTNTEVITAEPDYIYTFSLNFPRDKEDEIIRQPILLMIERYFTSGKNVIFLEGDEDTGKTTILKQFVKHKYRVTFSSFLNPVNKISSGTEQFLHDLCLQLHWFVYETELHDLGKINPPYYQTLLIELKRKRRKKNETFFFIIDGLPKDSKKHNELIEYIFEILPLGEDGYKFLFSGDFETYKSCIPTNNKIIATPLGLQNFSIEEAMKFFEECDLPQTDVKILWNEASGGIPGKLANFKRLLREDGGSVDELLNRIDSSSIYDYDWNKVQAASEKDPGLLEILAFISIDDKIYTVANLSRIIGITHETILSSLKSITSVTINQRDEIIFFSNKHKAFFSRKLGFMAHDVYSKNVNYLRSRGDSTEALLNVPAYFDKLNNYKEIVSFISEDYLPKIVTECQTLPEINSKIDMGYNAARQINKDSDILRFTVQGSLIKSIEGLHIWESELEARIALDDYENAIKLASSALLKEDRLRLLAKIGKQRVKSGQKVDEAILSELKTLYNEVDLQETGEKAINIAGDLLYCLPDLAINLIQNTADKEGKKNINDWLLTRLALSSVNSRQNENRPKISSILNTTETSSVHTALNFLYGDYSSAQFLSEVKKITSQSDRFFFLRLWLAENRTKKEIELVIDYALGALLDNDSKEVLNTSLLRDLSSNLKHISDGSIISHLSRKFADFRDEARSLGPTVEYFRFELNVIQALIKINYNQGIGLLLSLEKETHKIDDLLTKTECLALIKDFLDQAQNLIRTKRVHNFIIKQIDSALTNSIHQLINISSDHYSSLSDVVRITASINPDYACIVCDFANTHYRRIRLLALSFSSYIETNKIEHLDFKILNKIYRQIDFEILKEDCLRVLLEKVATEKQLNQSTIRQILPILDRIQKVKSSEFGCYLTVLSLRILYKQPEEFEEQIKTHTEQLRFFWGNLNSDLRKTEVGFFIASDLADVNKQLATNFLSSASQSKDNMWADSMNTIEIYRNSIRLLIRIFAGFVQSKSPCDVEFDKIENLISYIPANEDQIILWSYFARFLITNNEHTYFQKIAEQHIKPLYNEITDQSLRTSLFSMQLSEIFYIVNPTSTLHQIKELPIEERDSAYGNILDHLLFEIHPSEAYEDPSDYKAISLDEVNTILELMGSIVSDSMLFNYTSKLCKAIQTKRTLTEPQKKSVVRSLDELIHSKLPNAKFIRHNGFLIVSKAQTMRIDRQRSKDQTYIAALIEDSNKIDNLSDKAFVKALLAEVINSFREDLAKELIKDSLAIINQIECKSEYIERISHIAQIVHKVDIGLWKSCLKKAIGTTTPDVKDKIVENQRELIDLAFKYDKEFARDLISLLDKNEVRERHRRSKQIKKHFNTLELKNKIVNGEEFTAIRRTEKRAVAIACGIALGELNSNLIIGKNPEKMRNLLDVARKLPLRESFPILEYYLQNVVKRVKTSNDAKQYLTPFFNSCINLCNVVEKLSVSAKEKSQSFLSRHDLLDLNQKIFRPNSKDKAISFIRKWLNENAKDYVAILDSGFNKEQLEFLKVILDIDQTLEIEILTSVSSENSENMSKTIEDTYSTHWKTICRQAPPFTKIVVCYSSDTKKSPITDHCILTSGGGLSLGASLGLLGFNKGAITEMSSSDATELEDKVFRKYFYMKVREYKGEQIIYKPFPLKG